MMITLTDKKKVFEYLSSLVNRQIDTFKSAVLSAESSKNNETKSSAGDKYETGRAMMQMEQNKNEVQLQKAQQLRLILNQIDLNKKEDRIEQGSLVVTDNGVYFISIGIGKVEVDHVNYYCISVQSPIGMLLLGKSTGDSVIFLNKKIKVLHLL